MTLRLLAWCGAANVRPVGAGPRYRHERPGTGARIIDDFRNAGCGIGDDGECRGLCFDECIG